MKASLSPALKSQQLLQRVWAFALLALILLLSASCSLYLLSAVRAFVNGESLWSKAQKDAIYSLSRYADEGNPVDFAHYQRALQVPRGDAEARIALYDKPLRLDLARKGIEQGQNHPDDVSSLIWLLRTFRYFSWVQEPVAYWKLGDEYLNQLDTLAQEIRRGYEVGNISRENIATWKREIDLINQGVTALTRAFSDSLGQSSRNIVWLLLALNGALAIGLVSLWVWNTWRLILLREQVQEGLNSEKERAETTLAALSDAVITTNAKGLINYVNPAAIGLLGLQKQNYLDKPIKQVLQFYTMDASITSEGLLAQLVSETKESTVVRDEQTHWVRRTDHSIVPVKVLGSAMQREGQTSGAVFVLRDVSREQQYMDQISWNARHDTLTGLENRGEFERRLQKMLTQGLHQVKPYALLYIDLDQFKLINETSGHAAGDEVLCEVSRMLQANLRETDCLASMGGDEFAVLLENCPPSNVASIAEKLRLAAQQLQTTWGEKILRTGFSIGAVHVPGDAVNASDLLRMVDMACYQAKERGRNKVFFYKAEDGIYSRYVSEMEWATRIRTALDEERFCLYAQSIAPLQHSKSGKHGGMHFEVLLRLRDENGQILAPGHFIPAAERYGLMPSLDRWVISKTLQTLAQQPGHAKLVETCAINLSGPSLDDDGLLEFVKEQLQLHAIAAQKLCFEITETSAIGNLSNATRLIQALRALGCRFALDDFGVGMSSLTYLKQLPVDYLKIDGGFVRDMLKDKGDHAMVEMINRIGQTLGKKTVAEFVESREIAEELMSMGVDYVQGYAIARPKPMTSEYFAPTQENQLPQWCGALAMS
ncbi:EAL domain-containing protein [Comamonas testosteroni]|uniref:Diguanylate cyclase/phosphodiesterase with PAS/PAC sensor(S) n=1 Tax=Comamonas testosteroni (strain DSM 14576 / KF-1) TaxID=399795 RepID=B7WSK9_COMTK|nr:EAL domain-containing protein [Comamonas testosteroni]EED67303.1 diguanylate cyclase/phosphodiesterase with PAS/PAC sensor(s) [Comamonas testosteroni KF-1]WQG65476.1 EAL domain-containing protein [Comamonas testosteroni]